MRFKVKSVRINLISIFLCFYIVSGFIHYHFPLVILGAFYRFFERKEKMIMIIFVGLHYLYKSINTYFYTPILLETAYRLIDLIPKFQIMIPDYVSKIDEYVLFIPFWIRMIMISILIFVMIILFALSMIAMIPALLNSFLLYKLIFGNMENMEYAIINETKDFLLFTQLYFILNRISYLFLIPFLTHYFLSFIKFYDRIPKLKAFMGD